MNNFNMHNYDTSAQTNLNKQLFNYGGVSSGMQIDDISNLVNKIDSVLGNDDKAFSKTDSTLERENIPKINFSKFQKQIDEPIMIQSTFQNPTFDFAFNKQVDTNNQIKMSESYINQSNFIPNKRSLNSILKDITKINCDLDSIGNFSAPPQSSYRSMNYPEKASRFQSNKIYQSDPQYLSYEPFCNQNNDQSLDSIIQNVANLVKKLKTGTAKQAGVELHSPTPQFGFNREVDHFSQPMQIPERRAEERYPYYDENLRIKNKHENPKNYKQECKSNKDSITDRSILEREEEISPMRYQPDFTSNHLKKIHSKLDNEEEKFDQRVREDPHNQNFTIHDVTENRNRISRNPEPPRRGSAITRNRSQSRCSEHPAYNITRVNARTPTRITNIEDLYSEQSQNANSNIEAGRKPSIQFASKFINIPTNITTRSKRSRDSYA